MLIPAVAAAGLSRSGTPSVQFSASGPVGMKIRGTTSDLVIADRDDKIVVRVPLSGLKTGIGLRDTHMREKYLQVAQYPNAELSVPRSSLKVPGDGAAASATAQGTLTLHGKTKPVSFHYEAKRAGSTIHVAGTLNLNMNDFGIQVPSYAGVTVKPDVTVDAEFDATNG